MDGLRAVWHAGSFSVYPQFRFHPKQFMIGTDPVAMDRLLIDIIDGKRKQEGAPSVFDRSPERIKAWKDPDPAVNLLHPRTRPHRIFRRSGIGRLRYRSDPRAQGVRVIVTRSRPPPLSKRASPK